MEESNKERRIISPEDFLTGQGVDIHRYKLDKALVAFMSVGDMSSKFDGKFTDRPLFSHTREPYLIRDDGTVLVGRIYGGPFCSIVLQELAVFGVKYVIGYGFSGTLDNNVPLGSIMVAESGICSDGTSREYTDDFEILADSALLASITKIAADRGIEVISGKVWTTDALYREYPTKIAAWQKAGARFCNLETSPFYAVAREVGLKAIYLSVVSDNVRKVDWSGWSPELDKATINMWEICLDAVDSLN